MSTASLNNQVKYHHANLPLTNLHYLTYGEGPPLIIVPATISDINNWLDLIYFMGQRFTVYFFELPGHGQSTPFLKLYSSDMVAESIEHFIDAQQIDRFSLMGFSFGGILTLKTLHRLGDRIERVIVFAPCVTHRAVRYSRARLAAMRRLTSLMKSQRAQGQLHRFITNGGMIEVTLALMRLLGRVETLEGLDKRLLHLPSSTLDVLVYQANEIFNFEFVSEHLPFSQPCHFGMSVKDPLLDFKVTHDFLRRAFTDLQVIKLDYPFHQPHPPFSLEKLNQDFSPLLYSIDL